MKQTIQQTLINWVLVKQNNESKICNFADNYYGDQRCLKLQPVGNKKAK